MESRAWCLCDRGIRINLCQFCDLSVLCTDHVLDDDLVDHRTERSTHPRHQTHHQADLQNKGTAAIHEEIIPGLILRVNNSLNKCAGTDCVPHKALVRSLGVAGRLVRLLPHMISVADNAVGDVVQLHALTFGPLWREMERRAGE